MKYVFSDLKYFYSNAYVIIRILFSVELFVKKEDTMQLFKLFITALMPALKLLLVTLVGTFLALQRINVLNKSDRKHLNTVSLILSSLFVLSLIQSTFFL